MFNYVQIPKWLHEIHGERARVIDLMFVYLSGAVAALIFLKGLESVWLPFWKHVLIAILMVDIGGGVTANFSSSTRHYYKGKKKLRVGFLILHVLQPILFTLIFPQYWRFFLFLVLFTLPAALVVNGIKDQELRRNFASLLTVIGFGISFLVLLDPGVLRFMALLFILKLIMGFAAGSTHSSQDG